MRKTFSLKALLMLVVFALAGFSSAKALDLPIDEGFTPETYTDYTFTPASSGTLTMTTTGDPLLYFWMQTPLLTANGVEVPVASSNGNPDMFEGASTISWILTGGVTYTFYLDSGKSPAELGTYTFTFSGEISGGGDTPGTGGDKTIQLGVPFNVPSIPFGGTPEAYPFTSPFTGKLKVETNKWFGLCDTWGPPYTTYFFFKDKNGNNPMAATALEDGTDGYTLVFDVTENTTYYVIFDDAVTLTFLQDDGSGNTGGGDTGNVLPVPTTNFTLSQNMYTYTPSETGVLTIVYENQPWDNCLYSSWEGNHGGTKVPTVDGIDPNTATTFSWVVEGGKTYYLDSSYPANNVVTTSFLAEGGSGGGTGDEEIDGYAPVKLGQVYDIADGETLAVYFTAPADGTLTINQWGSDAPYLFLAPTKNPEDYDNAATNEGYMGSDPCVYTYLVSKGTTYYYYGVHNQAAYFELNKVSFAFQAGEIGGGDDNPSNPEVPAGWELAEYGKTYLTNGVGAVKLVVMPNVSGVLTVTQNGSYDSHLFRAEPQYDEAYGYENNYGIMLQPVNGYQDGVYPCPLDYSVAQGGTYYFVGKLSSGDGISSVTFTLEGAQTGTEIVLDTPYIVNESSEIMSYTPTESGILSVQWGPGTANGELAYDTGLVWGSQQFFLYSDYGLGNPMPLLSKSDGDGSGWLVTFNVEAGKTYYLHSPVMPLFQFVCSLATGETMKASITSIEPVPGSAYDVTNFRYYWNMIFAPNQATVDRVTMTYTPVNSNTPTTIEVSPNPEMGGDAFRVPADQLTKLIEAGDIKNETEITFTFYGLKAGGQYVEQNLLSEGKQFVTIGENGLVTVKYIMGTPIALENAQFPNPFRKAWERGDSDGIATMTFDSEVYVVNSVSVIAGHHYYGSESGGENVYSQTLPEQNISWEGNVVKIDFTGINWNMPAGTNEVTIFVAGPVGMNMLPASYDGVPVYTQYCTFTTEGSAEIDEPIIFYIDPRDGVTFSGLNEDEIIQIQLLEGPAGATTKLVGVLTDEDGDEMATFDFMQSVLGWIVEIEDDIPFYAGQTYYFTVTAYGENDVKIGSQVIEWYGDYVGGGDEPEPDDIWYVRCNANGFNPDGNSAWALLPSEDAEENGVYTGVVTMNGDFQFNLLSPYGMVFVPVNETFVPENVTVEFENNVFEGPTDYAFDETEEAIVWTVAGYDGVQLTISLDTNEGVVTLSVPSGSGVQFNVVDGSAVYFDLQGRKVVNPDKGIYIKVQDGKAIKVVK